MDGAGDGRGRQQSVGPQVKHLDVIVHTQLPKPTCLGREVKKGPTLLQKRREMDDTNRHTATFCQHNCVCGSVHMCVWGGGGSVRGKHYNTTQEVLLL